MSDVVFGRLTDLPLREAWTHEAHAFTPWLAENIDHLSEVIGVPLELTDTEVRVETFAADILARNPQDDSIVLIENQLEVTNHTHLGQIMTYLAGLEAQTVVWIAPSFREPHLSAIRWLNEHTADGFSFFAVKLRVVRIGDSPFAPVFEVVEKPNDWDRSIKVKAQRSTSETTAARERFWQYLAERHPDLQALGFAPGRHSNVWLPVGDHGVKVGLYISANSSGLYVRGNSSQPIDEVLSLLGPEPERLEQVLDAPIRQDDAPDWAFVSSLSKVYTNKADWPEITDWFSERIGLYVATLRSAIEGEA